MTFYRLSAFGLAPPRAMTANDNWRAPETLSIALDTWAGRRIRLRNGTPLRQIIACNEAP
jgi:hypothetical protein